MKKIDRNSKYREKRNFSSINTVTCPQCGDGNTRYSSPHYSRDNLIRILLFKPYRCRICNFRFWLARPLIWALLSGTLLALVIISGALWITAPEATSAVELTENFDDGLKDRAMKGDAEAELKMGLQYAEGDGVIRNNKEAIRWFEKAALHGQVEAQYHYGLALLNGRGVLQDYKEAFHWIEQSAQRGYSHAQFQLGEIYRNGIGTEIDNARAYLWYNLAAAQGIDEAASIRDSLVGQLQPKQIAAMQEESRRISHSETSKSIEDVPKASTTEPAQGL